MIKTNFNIRVSDPLLEPYLPVIRRRHECSVLRELEFTGGQKLLADVFNSHLYFGLHHLEGGGWVLREWAPNASAIWLLQELWTHTNATFFLFMKASLPVICYLYKRKHYRYMSKYFLSCHSFFIPIHQVSTLFHYR